MSEFYKIVLYENIDKQLVKDLTKMYGVPGIIQDKGSCTRWFFNQNSIYFSKKADHLLFLLKYS